MSNEGAISNEGPKTAAEAFAVANWKRMLPELLGYAKGCLSGQGFGERGARKSAVLEAQELVNTAIESILSGERTWSPEHGKTEKALVGMICMTMRSIAAHARKNRAVAKRARPDRAERALERTVSDRSNQEDELAAAQELGEIRAALGDDADAIALVGAYAEGHVKREDARGALKWTTERVKITQKRMRRTLAARGLAGLGERTDEEAS